MSWNWRKKKSQSKKVLRGKSSIDKYLRSERKWFMTLLKFVAANWIRVFEWFKLRFTESISEEGIFVYPFEESGLCYFKIVIIKIVTKIIK